MKVDGPFYAKLGEAAAEARRLASIGYDGVYTLEGSCDPFYPLVIASEHAPEMDIATGIAVAFPRNPLHLAYQAWDLQTFSQGKFLLGIGSQVKAHIEKRFGVEFSPPASRMRDYILATKAIFECWQSGEKLDYRGEYYQHTLMTPMFNPGPNAFGPPPILLGAMGPKMTEVAGEVADGFIVHPFHSMPFLLDKSLPAIDLGLQKSGRSRGDFIVQVNAIVITGEDDESRRTAREKVKSLLGFYASTPAYRPPMEAVGFADLQPILNQMSKEGKWGELGNRIGDDFVDAFTTQGRPDEIAEKLRQKYGSCADRLAIYAPYEARDSMWRQIITELKKP